jgi:hypothetical protein
MRIPKILYVIAALLIFFAAWDYTLRSSAPVPPLAPVVDQQNIDKFSQRLKELRENPQARQDMIDWAEREHICVSPSGCK